MKLLVDSLNSNYSIVLHFERWQNRISHIHFVHKPYLNSISSFFTSYSFCILTIKPWFVNDMNLTSLTHWNKCDPFQWANWSHTQAKVRNWTIQQNYAICSIAMSMNLSSNYFWTIWYYLTNWSFNYWWYLCFIRIEALGVEIGIIVFQFHFLL